MLWTRDDCTMYLICACVCLCIGTGLFSVFVFVCVYAVLHIFHWDYVLVWLCTKTAEEKQIGISFSWRFFPSPSSGWKINREKNVHLFECGATWNSCFIRFCVRCCGCNKHSHTYVYYMHLLLPSLAHVAPISTRFDLLLFSLFCVTCFTSSIWTLIFIVQ